MGLIVILLVLEASWLFWGSWNPDFNICPSLRDGKGTPKNFCDKDFAELSGELSGAICLKAFLRGGGRVYLEPLGSRNFIRHPLCPPPLEGCFGGVIIFVRLPF